MLKYKELQTIITIITEDKVFLFVQGNSRIILYDRLFLQVFWCHDEKYTLKKADTKQQYHPKKLPSCVSTGDQALFTQRGSAIILCFALWLLVVFIENIRNSIEVLNGVLLHSSLSRKRYLSVKILISFQISPYLFWKPTLCMSLLNFV